MWAQIREMSTKDLCMDIIQLLSLAMTHQASDIHLSAGLPPMMRIHGDLQTIEMPILAHQDVLTMMLGIMQEAQQREYAEKQEIDFSMEIPDLARFRVNMFTQHRGAASVFRMIPSKIPTVEILNLPNVLKEIAAISKGLVLVTGPTGSGKSTTLAAMINHINATRHDHILTMEDPIEFVYDSQKSLINQREIRRDTPSFASALRAALREDPDVILVGELRDAETIRLAITAAETGHLVFGTLHTQSAPKTVNRIIDVFAGDEKNMVRSMLSESLQAVIAQTLLKKNGGGRVPALEIMIANSAIRNLIREDKIAQMYSSIQTGKAAGMQTLDQHLMQLVQDATIASQAARQVAMDKSLF